MRKFFTQENTLEYVCEMTAILYMLNQFLGISVVNLPIVILYWLTDTRMM